MKTSSVKVLALAVPLCFFLGAWWGFESIQKKVQSHLRPANELRVLTLKGFFPQSLVDKIRQKANIQLLITEMDSEMELLNEARSNAEVYDLFQITSYQVDFLRDSNTLLKLPRLERVTQISVDFKQMMSQESFPILWAVNGFLVSGEAEASLNDWHEKNSKISILASEYEALYQFSKIKPEAMSWLKQNNEKLLNKTLRDFKTKVQLTPHPFEVFQETPNKFIAIQAPSGPAQYYLKNHSDLKWKYKLPKSGASLFTENLAISAKSDKVVLATRFLKTLLQPKMVVELSQSRHMASTLEYRLLPDQYHPRALRRFPLDRLHVVSYHKVFETSWPHLYREILWPQAVPTESK